MKNLQDVRKWLTEKYSYWRKFQDKGVPIDDLALARMEGAEIAIGAIALWSIMLLIKIQHIKGGGNNYDSIMRMDGNADNWHELSDYRPPSSVYQYGNEEHDKLLVKTASSLLRYGS
tara:strand:- start:31931 stop:32281 length:351 start_codon:yes stop_codon:yes gene_type:complete